MPEVTIGFGAAEGATRPAPELGEAVMGFIDRMFGINFYTGCSSEAQALMQDQAARKIAGLAQIAVDQQTEERYRRLAVISWGTNNNSWQARDVVTHLFSDVETVPCLAESSVRQQHGYLYLPPA